MVDQEALNVCDAAVGAGVNESRAAPQLAKAWPGVGETGEQLPVRNRASPRQAVWIHAV